jgi:O-antigen ligase
LYFVAKNKLLYSLPFVCFLALTFSRASYLTFLVGIIYELVTHKKIKLLFLLGLLCLLIYLVPKPFGEGVNLLRTFSIYSRFESWQQGIALFTQKPILGWGYNTLRATDGSRMQIDNSFIFLLATTGIVGFLSFLNLLREIGRHITDRGVKLVFFSILFHSLTNNSLLYIWILAFFWCAVGIGQTKLKEYKQA